MKYFIFFLSMFGCASHEPPKYDHCGEPARAYRNGSQPSTNYDNVNEEAAKQGCKKFYGPNACLNIFIKTGPDSYWAICRR